MVGKIPTEQQEDPPEPVLTVKVAGEVIRELKQEGKTCSDFGSFDNRHCGSVQKMNLNQP